MGRQYSHPTPASSQARDRHDDNRYDHHRDPKRSAAPAHRRISGGGHLFHGLPSPNKPSFRRLTGNSSRRRSSLGGFLARRASRRSIPGSPLPCSPSNPSSRSTQRPNWETEMEMYFDALRQNVGGQKDLDPIVNDPNVRHDRQQRGHFHCNEFVANQFDVSLQHVRDLLHHMYDRYNTVTCYSGRLINPGHIIYYIEPFVLGFDQEVQGDAVSVLGGSRFQAAVQAKGRLGIVTRIIGGRTFKVAPIYTFNGDGMSSKPPSVREEYVELRTGGQYTWGWASPHVSVEVDKAACHMKPGAAVHLVTSKVTLSSQILIAGSITPKSLESLRALIILNEECIEE